jgi:hypothetical protein
LHHRSLWDDDDNGHHDGHCVHYSFCSSSFIVPRFILLFNSFLLESKWVAPETIHQTGYFQRRQISIIKSRTRHSCSLFPRPVSHYAFFPGEKRKDAAADEKKNNNYDYFVSHSALIA